MSQSPPQIRPDTRDAILEAAFQVFGRDPTASLADVAARAGVGRATLHRHFRGREDLMAALARAATREIDAAVEAATRDAASYGEALRRSLDAMVPLASRQWFLSRELFEDNPEVMADHRRQQAELDEAIEAAKAEGCFDPALPTAWIRQAFDYLLFAAWESVHAGEATPAQAAELAWRTLTRGLGSGLDDR